MEDLIFKWAPLVLVIILILLQNRIFVTPEQLEKKHREILNDAEERFVLIKQYQEMKELICDLKGDIKQLYDLLREKQ